MKSRENHNKNINANKFATPKISKKLLIKKNLKYFPNGFWL